MADLLELLRSRRSVRTFRPDLPPREVIEGLIEAAVTAPSASNRQPWRFLLVSDRDTLSRLAAAVREATRHIGEHVEPVYRDSFLAYGDYFTRFEGAPAVVVPLCRSLATLSNMVAPGLDPAARERIAAMEDDSGLISTSLAIQNLLLAAHAAGLGASCMTGPLIAIDQLRPILKVQASWKVVALIPVGYSAEEPEARPRKAAADVIKWID